MPYVGPALAVAGILLLGVVIAYTIHIYKESDAARIAGSYLIKLAFIAQIVSIALLINGIKTTSDVYPKLQAQLTTDPGQYVTAGMAIAETQQMSVAELSALTVSQHEQLGKNYVQSTGSTMFLSLNTNPVEVAALLTGLVGTLFVILFGFRTEKLRERLPSLESLDNLMYKTACLAFAGLAMLLITGAFWANESWGRPWGFDSKETGALIAWLTYAAFLHTRISRGWRGRSSAYFAIIGFLFVIFTYLGVSYLLKGLHSYA